MSLTFPCAHCQTENTVEPQLAGCVVTCAGCKRSVIVPMKDAPIVPAVPAPTWRGGVRRLFITAGFALGAGLLLGMVSLVVGLFVEHQTIGMTKYDALFIGLIGFVAGAILGGLAGWQVSRE